MFLKAKKSLLLSMYGAVIADIYIDVFSLYVKMSSESQGGVPVISIESYVAISKSLTLFGALVGLVVSLVSRRRVEISLWHYVIPIVLFLASNFICDYMMCDVWMTRF